MTLVHVAIFVLSLGGFVALALSMQRHASQLAGKALPAAQARFLRIGGWALLAAALALSLWKWRYGIGAVTWLGWLAVAGAGWAFLLSRLSRQRDARSPKRLSESSQGPTPAEHRRLPGAKLAVFVFVLPVAAFAWHLIAPTADPLAPATVMQAPVGPWVFSLAETDHKSPVGVPPLKSFTIRLCDGCSPDVRTAYMSARSIHLRIGKPTSLRTAGSVFTGDGPEKTAAIVVPAAAIPSDGLWLTVESSNGEIYYQHLEVARVSPALDAYLRAHARGT